MDAHTEAETKGMIARSEKRLLFLFASVVLFAAIGVAYLDKSLPIGIHHLSSSVAKDLPELQTKVKTLESQLQLQAVKLLELENRLSKLGISIEKKATTDEIAALFVPKTDLSTFKQSVDKRSSTLETDLSALQAYLKTVKDVN